MPIDETEATQLVSQEPALLRTQIDDDEGTDVVGAPTLGTLRVTAFYDRPKPFVIGDGGDLGPDVYSATKRFLGLSGSATGGREKAIGVRMISGSKRCSVLRFIYCVPPDLERSLQQ